MLVNVHIFTSDMQKFAKTKQMNGLFVLPNGMILMNLQEIIKNWQLNWLSSHSKRKVVFEQLLKMKKAFTNEFKITKFTIPIWKLFFQLEVTNMEQILFPKWPQMD